MPTYIPKNFTPTDKTYDFLKDNHRIPREFLDERVTEHFICYWNELKDDKKEKGKKEAWQTTYMNWAKSAWRGRVGRDWEDHRHDRNGFGKNKPHVFQEVLGKKLSEDLKPPVKSTPPRYRLPDPPPDTGERMTQDEAFAKLDKMFQVKS